MYTTFEEENNTDPSWNESFDVEIEDLSTVVIRVFDRKCIDFGLPAFIGFTTILPFSLLPPKNEDANSSPDSQVNVDMIPLVREGVVISGMSISISLSTDTREPPTMAHAPPHLYGPEETRVERRVALFKCGNRKTVGRKKVTTTRVYQLEWVVLFFLNRSPAESRINHDNCSAWKCWSYGSSLIDIHVAYTRIRTLLFYGYISIPFLGWILLIYYIPIWSLTVFVYPSV